MKGCQNLPMFWQDFKASPEVVKLLKFGHKIQFEVQPRLSLPRASHDTKLSPLDMTTIKNEVFDLINKGAMRLVSDAEAKIVLGFYSKLFVVPKPEKGSQSVMRNYRAVMSPISSNAIITRSP